MSTGIDGIYAMPNPDDSVAWERWKLTLEAHLISQVTSEHPTQYFFSSTGSNANDGLTPATPKQTIAAANALIANGNDILLKRGDIFDSLTGFNITGINNWTLRDYGDTTKQPPLVNGYTIKFDGNGWTDNGNGTYSRAYSATTIGDLRFPTYRWKIFIRCLTNVTAANPYSFYHDGTTLTVNANAAIVPGYTFEAAPFGTNYGINVVACDNVLIKNIRTDGFGLTSNSAHNYNVFLSANVNQLIVYQNCEAYRGGYHLIGCAGEGITLVKNARAGLTCSEDASAVFVGFTDVTTGSPKGEHYFFDLTISHGRIPHTGWYNATTAPVDGQGCYAHTADVGDYSKCVIFCDITYENNLFGVKGTTSMGGSDTPATMSDYRLFLIREKVLGYPKMRGSLGPGVNAYKRDCIYEIRAYDTNAWNVSDGWNDRGGKITNCSYRVNIEDLSGFNIANFFFDVLTLIDAQHCHFEFFNTNNRPVNLVQSTNVNLTGTTINNSTIMFSGDHTSSALNMPAGTLVNNQYIGVPVSDDQYAIIDNPKPSHRLPPIYTDSRRSKNVTGRNIKYDMLMRPRRNASSVGPLEYIDNTERSNNVYLVSDGTNQYVLQQKQ